LSDGWKGKLQQWVKWYPVKPKERRLRSTNGTHDDAAHSIMIENSNSNVGAAAAAQKGMIGEKNQLF
jgi:hypothetical protein